ncbi:fructose-6-phosphate aldolase [Alkaliphilus sp. B6464]|uniref:fructose-6-phosphate aldolase n=1 Tax=Alkaliphilus sp. B6464 TaxID=2731219 RepID=UPI001BABC808|nr:fructose-6-phosphate aldolase [Alkaliphilus sp. B6464]QUH19138.1 fructose-6-phosphate aldolase [Alkaliphilus sp. B6464]
MKLFIDSANIDEIREISKWGILSGVTTNPSLIAKEGRDLKQVIEEITQLVDGPISAEVVGETAEEMVSEAEDLIKIHSNVVIKVPMTEEGLKAVSNFSSRGIKTNVTLVFSATQALLAARAGASFVSPFLGRLDDIGYDGVQLVEEIAHIFEVHNISTEIIAASTRHNLHVVDAAKAGSHIATIPYNILKQMVKHPLTDIGIEKFLADWEKTKR